MSCLACLRLCSLLNRLACQLSRKSTTATALLVPATSATLPTVHRPTSTSSTSLCALQVCHRDLKPGNILLGPGYTVKLCDFGSAYSPVLGSDLVHDPAAQGGSAAITAALDNIASSPFGTSSAAGNGTGPLAVAAASRWYCAPESLLGGGASPASDIWAFGESRRSGGMHLCTARVRKPAPSTFFDLGQRTRYDYSKSAMWVGRRG